MIKAAEIIMDKGICTLSYVFKEVFPDITYTTNNAKRRLLQLPLVALRINDISSGKAEVNLMEVVKGVDYVKFRHALTACASKQASSSPNLTKKELRQLLSLAQSDRERELVRYTAFRASGLSATGARRHYGLENMAQRSSRIQECVKEAESIRGSIEELAQVQEQVASRSLGLISSSDSESSESDEENDQDMLCAPIEILPGELEEVLISSCFNWFAIVETVTERYGDIMELQLEKYYTAVMSSNHSEAEKRLLEQSHQAYLANIESQRLADRQAESLNGMIVTDSESEDPDQYLHLDLSSEQAQEVIARKRKSIRRRARYLKAKRLAERNFLRRKTSRSARGILKDHPDIMEKFVEDRNIGADAWRRTGVLTFDGNTHVKEKVTYDRIRQHLMSVYKRHFSYGTIVQLCVARNRKRKSAQRYKGVAKITSRRARKGFQLKFNPDSHWSGALYRTLNVLQYTDGQHIININRDDASGFRLDTMTTHRLNRTPMVQGSDANTTYTDYVNRYKAVLQTTSYNFTKTENTAEICAGVVKPTGVFPKNPTQHMCDLNMLETTPEIHPAFVNPLTGERKLIECIRVDGAADEGPCHEEVQFLWTARHLEKSSIATLVTTRSSGSSFLNRVELQNGCLSLAHSNIFIPSTLGGSCFSSATGKVDKEKYTKNMDLATDVYISRANHCPCGETVINLFKGGDSSQKQEERKFLIMFLKGSKKQQEAIKHEHPDLYSYFERVWALRERHMVTGVPSQYIFFLLCCLKPDCIHPICKSQTVTQYPTWYNGGPSVSYIPLPIPDPNRPWGRSDCDQCKGTCYGHFLKPTEALRSTLTSMAVPPSGILREAFQTVSQYPPSEAVCQEVAERVLLSPDQVRMWFEHLHTIKENRKRGAARAAATRRKKKEEKQEKESLCYCAVCLTPYQEFTDSVEDWIGCETCNSWFHFVCVSIDSTCVPDKFYCEECSAL